MMKQEQEAYSGMPGKITIGRNKLYLTFVLLFAVFSFCSCRQKKPEPEFTSNDISHIIRQMTDVMVHDITNPPLAARFFSYACLAGYEVVAAHDKTLSSMYGVLNDYPDIRENDSIKSYNYQLAALLAMIETARKMQPSGKLLNIYESRFLDSCKRIGFEEDVINNSMAYAQSISKQILAYAKADGYNKISNLPRYTPVDKEGSWFPTPPGFMAAIEPYFNTVRSFTLRTPSQFAPVPPTTFDSKRGSKFYLLADAVYKESIQPGAEHQAIASFWDCNPFAMQDRGHLQYGFKKISPGAHWLGITGIVCKKANKTFNESMEIYSMVSIGLMDAFICCWDEKFRSNRIRPETAIRKYIDPSWEPLLQTPPFPEYLSGHSTISSAAATILTNYFGDNYVYTDSVEVLYGLPAREFKSFYQAANEAGVSRFYGGIHFMDAIDNGRMQGLKVGEWVLNRFRATK
jgi:hypothetical protein